MHILRSHYRHVTAFLPFICASAGTLAALGADEIRMGPGAYLSPVDSALDHPLCPVSATSPEETVAITQDQFRRVLRLWRKGPNGTNPCTELFKYIHPVVIGELDRSDALSLRICRELLGYHMGNARRAERISKTLCFGYPSHMYPITLREAKRLGLNVKPLDAGVESLLRELDALYADLASPVKEYQNANQFSSGFVPSILERSGLQTFEVHHAEMKYRPEARRWTSWAEKEWRHELALVKGRWAHTVQAIG
jgi:hypothetical protein